jgi:hypothetical protein
MFEYEYHYDFADKFYDVLPGIIFGGVVFLMIILAVFVVGAILAICLANKSKGEKTIMNRNIALCIVLSVVTCGIYSIYWFVVLTDEIHREKTTNTDLPSGVVCFLLAIVTCNIYGIYWAYKMGEKMDLIKSEKEIPGGRDSNVLYLILELFGLNPIVLALLQNDLNKLHPVQ